MVGVSNAEPIARHFLCVKILSPNMSGIKGVCDILADECCISSVLAVELSLSHSLSVNDFALAIAVTPIEEPRYE
jgi:hypothetical protein